MHIFPLFVSRVSRVTAFSIWSTTKCARII